MSIEFFAYSEDATPVPIKDVLACCRNASFECRVIREKPEPDVSGTLRSEDAISGWKPSLFGNRKAQLAASRADWKSLNDLTDQNVIGVCTIEIWTDPSEFNDEAEIEEASSVYGLDFASYRRKSQVRWYIRLASGRSALSVALAEVVLKALLKMRGGIFEDPQSGECQLFERHEERA